MTDIQILLVHGTAHGAWCWERLLPELSALGLRGWAIDLPGHGSDPRGPESLTLEDYAAAIETEARQIRGEGGRVAVLGHSSGGFSISAAALRAPGLFERLIYLCAYLPQDGRSLVEMRKVWPEQPLMAAVRPGADSHSFTFAHEHLETLFYHDCPPGTVKFAQTRLRPEPLAPQVAPLSFTDAFRELRKDYIVCAEDRAIPPAYQRVMAAGLPPAQVSELPLSHSPFFADPRGLALRIQRILAG